MRENEKESHCSDLRSVNFLYLLFIISSYLVYEMKCTRFHDLRELKCQNQEINVGQNRNCVLSTDQHLFGFLQIFNVLLNFCQNQADLSRERWCLHSTWKTQVSAFF